MQPTKVAHGIREQFAEAALDSKDAPSPLPGMDGATYGNFLVRALSGDESVPAAVLTRVRVTRGEDTPEDRKSSSQPLRDFLLRRVIEQQLEEIDRLIAHYNSMADWHRNQAVAARGRMQDTLDQLNEVGEFLTEANKLLEEYERTGKLDREKALEELRRRGIVADADWEDDQLLDLLTDGMKKAAEERDRLLDRLDQDELEAKRHEELERESRRKAQELVDHRDTIRARVQSGEINAQEASRQLGKINNEYKADIQIRADDIEQKRQQSDPGYETTKPVASIDAKVFAQSQTQDEEADYLASLSKLKATFTKAAAGEKVEEPEPDTPTPIGPAPGTPGMKV